jgi:hypothetical protein
LRIQALTILSAAAIAPFIMVFATVLAFFAGCV